MSCRLVWLLQFETSFPPPSFCHKGVPIFAGAEAELRKSTSSRDVYLAGAVKAPHTWTVWWGGLHLISSWSCCADDPELWDFTLYGIEDLDVPAAAPSHRGTRPSTPGNHQMQTRSKTPQRTADRRPEAPPNSRGQEQAQYRPQQQNQYQGRPGESDQSVNELQC